MTSPDSIWIRVRIGAAIAVLLAVATASVIATTGAASGAAAQRHPGFGAAARVAVGQAAARLTRGSSTSVPATNR